MKEARLTTREILGRDEEDASKLKQGIDLAISKGVIPASVEVEETMVIDVMGLSVDNVCDAIVSK